MTNDDILDMLGFCSDADTFYEDDDDMLSFEQTEEDNRIEFVERLMKAGWPPDEAHEEWMRIQRETEGDL